MPRQYTCTLAVSILESHTKKWWKSLIGSTFHGRVYKDISWNEFSEAFLKYFVPSTSRVELESHTQKGGGSPLWVPLYQQEFQYLAKFADFYDLDDRGYTKQFYKGLRDPLRQALLFIMNLSLKEIINMAKRLEAGHLGIQASCKRTIEGMMEAGPSFRMRQNIRCGRGNQRGGGHFHQNFMMERPSPQLTLFPPLLFQPHQQLGGLMSPHFTLIFGLIWASFIALALHLRAFIAYLCLCTYFTIKCTVGPLLCAFCVSILLLFFSPISGMWCTRSGDLSAPSAGTVVVRVLWNCS
ncbi:hypothetical protein KSP40_PGU014970 [Platanthera guangdongensis]|uniref:Retrotransposon gag domain-containing protein n=1 Tax=Platanthera guangdongensis TaxID=2320717 RepID=A0ABR2MQN1_9ASPA